jgi:hypothetical protein
LPEKNNQMKRIIITGVLFVFISGMAEVSFGQAKGFGIGVILGEPTGISVKKWVGDKSAFDGAAAWSFQGTGFLQLHADYLHHNFKLIGINQGQLPVYYGLGVKMVFANDPTVGIRIPLGINYIFGDAPLDLFGELVPTLNLIPATEFNFGGGIGIRYWFHK